MHLKKGQLHPHLKQYIGKSINVIEHRSFQNGGKVEFFDVIPHFIGRNLSGHNVITFAAPDRSIHYIQDWKKVSITHTKTK